MIILNWLTVLQIYHMNRRSTGSKRFNFNDIDQQNSQVMPQKPRPNKSKRSYNFSLIDDSDDKPRSFIKKTSKAAHSSEKEALVRETAEEEVFEESAAISQEISKERKKQQQERDKNFAEQLLAAIIKSDEEKFLSNLLQLATQKKLSYLEYNALLFLLLKESFKNPCSFCVEDNYAGVIASKAPIMVDELSSLRKWGVYSLRTFGEEMNKIIEKRKAPKRLGRLAEHRIKELAEEFESLNNYDDCLAVCRIEDMAFRDSYEFSSSKEMKNQFSIISSGTLKAIPHTAWLVDLSLALLYFDPIPLQDLLRDLNKKYAKSLHPFMAPHFLLLNLNKGSPHSMKDTIAQIVANSPKQLDQLNQILYMWTLNSHRARAADTFQKAVQSIIKNIRSLPLFVDFLCYLRLDAAKVKNYFDFFLWQNISLGSRRDEKIEEMKSYIIKRDRQSRLSRSDTTIQILVKWVKCESFLHQDDKIQSLKYLAANFQLLSLPVIHSSSEIYQAMIDSLLTFELLCTYKSQQKRKLSQVLNDLTKLLEVGKEKQIIKGIIAFLQLKGKVDWSSKPQKMADFFYVFGVLEDRENGGDESSRRIKACLIKALSNFLESSQGELYMHKLSSPYSNAQSIALAKYLDSPDSLEASGVDKALILKSPFVSLASMLKTVPKLTRKIAAILLL